MLRFTLTLLTFGLSFPAISQQWVWAKNLGGSVGGFSADIVTTNTFDSDGNVLAAGFQTSTTETCSDLTIGGFYARFDLSGNCLGRQAVSGRPKSISVDLEGNIIVLSNTYDTTFLNKYDLNDQLQWSDTLINAYGSATAIDSSGNIFFCGEIEELGAIGSCLQVETSVVTFIAKYDPNGDCSWADTVWNASFRAVCLDQFGNVYATGSFEDSITIGGHELSSAGGSDVFVVKYDESGNCLWAQRGGGPYPQFSNQFTAEQGNAITYSSSGFIYVTGVHSDSADFGTTLLLGSGSSNTLLAKYDTDGNVVWAKGYQGGPDQMGLALAADDFGNVYLGSTFVWNVNLDNQTISGYNHFDVLVSRHDSDGNMVWATKAGGNDWNDFPTAISVSSGSVAVSGTVQGESYFGSTTLSEQGKQNFVALLSDETGIEDHNTVNVFQLYPNPSNGIVQIQTDGSGVLIQISEINGRIVGVKEISLSLETIDMTFLSSGLYHITAYRKDGQYLTTKKLVLHNN